MTLDATLNALADDLERRGDDFRRWANLDDDDSHDAVIGRTLVEVAAALRAALAGVAANPQEPAA